MPAIVIPETLAARLDRAACDAVVLWGSKAQFVATAEELAELSVLLLQKANEKYRPQQDANIREEICDCYIMLEQMRAIHFSNGDEFAASLDLKLRKLEGKVARMAAAK